MRETRYDLIVFPNGGHECSGFIAGDPVLAEKEYRPDLDQKIAAIQPDAEKAARVTFLIKKVLNKIVIEQLEWQGEIAMTEPEMGDR